MSRYVFDISEALVFSFEKHRFLGTNLLLGIFELLPKNLI